LSVFPGAELNAWLSVAPLVNIVLLARDTLGNAHPLGFVAVLTALYGTAALGLATRFLAAIRSSTTVKAVERLVPLPAEPCPADWPARELSGSDCAV
jgi:hypothetical protein